MRMLLSQGHSLLKGRANLAQVGIELLMTLESSCSPQDLPRLLWGLQLLIYLAGSIPGIQPWALCSGELGEWGIMASEGRP